MQHPEWFLNTVEPRMWVITNLDYGYNNYKEGARFAHPLLHPIQLSHHTSTCTHAIEVL